MLVVVAVSFGANSASLHQPASDEHTGNARSPHPSKVTFEVWRGPTGAARSGAKMEVTVLGELSRLLRDEKSAQYSSDQFYTARLPAEAG